MSLKLRGINYDVGTHYDAGHGPGRLSTHRYDIERHLRRDMDVLAAELHCNAVQLYGTDVDRLMVAASLALDRGLSPWIQPRLIGATPADHLDHLRHVARGAEWLRRRLDRVTLSVGAELSLFMSGIVEGRTVADRMEQLLAEASAPSSVAEDLNEHLRDAEAGARAHFGGQITYGAGPWERVNWRDMFDLVGLDVYLRPIDATSIVSHLQGFQHFQKPIVATEFGCVTNSLGADEYGADVVDWTTRPPRITGSTIRDEEVQARSLAIHLRAFDTAAIHGAFCFVFIEPIYLHDATPCRDLDMASFGVVAAVEDDDRPYPTDLSRGSANARSTSLPSCTAETEVQEPRPTPEDRLVVSNAVFGHAAGSWKATWPPVSGSIQMRPPWASTSPRAMASPSPPRPVARVRLGSARAKRSNA